MIRVLIVEDSAVIREYLAYILGSDPAIDVVTAASNGQEAVEAASRFKPDVITMDIHMPVMDGFEATRRIMTVQPTPIVIVSGSSTAKEASTAFRALEAGALTVVPRPPGIGHAEHQRSAAELIKTVKLMSEIKVIKRHTRQPVPVSATAASGKMQGDTRAEIKLVAMGASTGGPLVLQSILFHLPKNLPVPLLIVQHISPGFVQGFVEWLGNSTGFPVHTGAHGERIVPGHAYVAPDGSHMGLSRPDIIALSDDGPENGLRPSVSFLFRSVSNVLGGNAAGVLLSGMGKDGVSELKLMKDKGAVTIAQDEASSVIYGMPGEAIKIGAAAYVLSPEGIAATLSSLLNVQMRR